MKCPLSMVKSMTGYGEVTFEALDCLKEECAWWIGDCSRCCILDGVLCLNILNDHLDDIQFKMPKEV